MAVLFERRWPGGLLFVCEGGPLGSIGIPEDATDRAPDRASTPLTAEVLAALVELVAVLSESGRYPEPVLETYTSS